MFILSTRASAMASYLAGSLLLCSCALVVSTPAEDGGRGVPYSLPRSVLKVTTTVTPSTTPQLGALITLKVEPVHVADAGARFLLQHYTNIFFSETLDVTTNSRGLLESVSSVSDDQTGEILKSLAKAAIGVTQIQSTGLLARTDLDAAQRLVADIEHAMMTQLAQAGGTWETHVPLPASLASAKHTFPVTPNHPVPGWQLSISIEAVAPPDQPDEPPPAYRRHAPTDAVTGIVVRGNDPFVAKAELTWEWKIPEDLTARIAELRKGEEAQSASQLERLLLQVGATEGVIKKITTASSVFHLPDYAPAFVIPVYRAGFSKRDHTTTLVDGQLIKVESDQPSPIAGIVGWPLDVMRDVITIPTEFLQLKFDLATKQEALDNKETEAREAQAQAEVAYEEALAAAKAAEYVYENSRNVGDPERLIAAWGAFRVAAANANQAAIEAGKPIPFPTLPDLP